MANQTFVRDVLKVFFKHTDYHGYLHPYNYLEWTSYVRESFFSEMCPVFREIIESSIKMMTSKISSKMHSDAIFGDPVEARFNTLKIKRVSFDVLIRFYNKRTGVMTCETQHTLVFVDGVQGKFVDIPEGLKNVIADYELAEEVTRE